MNGEFQGSEGSDFVAPKGGLKERIQQRWKQNEAKNSPQVSESVENNEKEDRYPYGMAVRVPRSSGVVDEEGWVCIGRSEDGAIRLSKDKTQELKLLSEEELDKYNYSENIETSAISLHAVVKVQRTSGEIDDNWVVVDIDKREKPEDTIVTINKQNEQNQTMVKRVTLSELEKTNETEVKATENSEQNELANRSETDKPEIKLRSVVKVQRTGGEIDDNWVVVGLEQKEELGDTVVTISKPNEQNQTMIKQALLSELEKIN